jgi:hypothetical protein
MKNLKAKINNADILAYDQLQRINLGGEHKHKSTFGGYCTFCLVIAFLLLTGWKVTQLLEYNGTHTYEGELSSEEEVYATDQKYVFFITDLKKYYDFEEDKIDIYIGHFLYEYDQDGNRTTKETKYNISRCDLSDFDSNEYERNYFQSFKSLNPYCIKDPNKTLSLLGNKMNSQQNLPYSRFAIGINRCTNTSSSAEMDNCVSDQEMDAWLEDKIVTVALIKTQLVFKPPYSHEFK